jgi:hypothetical protein
MNTSDWPIGKYASALIRRNPNVMLSGIVIAIVTIVAIFGLVTLVRLVMWVIVLAIVTFSVYMVCHATYTSGNSQRSWKTAGFSGLAALCVWYFIPPSNPGSHQTSQSFTAAIPKWDASLASKIALPPEYRILCEHVAMELKVNPDEYRDDKAIAETIAEGHDSVMSLRSIKSDDSDIMYVASHAQTAFAEAITRLERINALPKPQGVSNLMVESFIHLLYGNFYQGYALGADADEKQKAIAVELEALLAAVDKADAAQMNLPTIAKKYAARTVKNSGRILIDIEEAWGWYGPHDWFCIYNSGSQPLEDCTIQVLLTGGAGDVRKNVHFIPHWPANSWIYARYDPGKAILDRAHAGRMTVTQIQKADVSIWSPTYSTNLSYTYQGEEKDKDIAERCKDLRFSGSYQRYVSGLVWDTQPGLKCKLEGVSIIPKCRVDVTFSNSSNSKSWYWELEYWEVGDEKEFTRTNEELDFLPTNVDMVVTFPNASYKHVTAIPVLH